MSKYTTFFDRLDPYADRIASQSNITSDQLMAMWANESSWGDDPRKLAARHNNFFGMVYSPWVQRQPGTYDSGVGHYENGKYENNFAGFDTLDDAMRIKESLILKRYNPTQILTDDAFGLFLLKNSYCTSGCTLYYKFGSLVRAVIKYRSLYKTPEPNVFQAPDDPIVKRNPVSVVVPIPSYGVPPLVRTTSTD